MLIQTNWTQLSNKSIVPLNDIAKIATRIELRLNAIKQGRRPPNSLMDVRSGLNVLISALISILHKDDVIQSKSDIELFKMFEDNFGRIIKVLDEKEDMLNSALKNGNMSIMLDSRGLSYITELESIFYGSIYYPIKRTLERKPKDSREFFYNLYEIMNINVSLFGAESRLKGKSSGRADIPPISAKTLMSDKGQEKLGKNFDTAFKGYEDLLVAQKVFENA